MKRKTMLLLALSALAGLFGVVQVTAQGPTPGARAPGTAPFTYQGQLRSGSSLYTGTCDFQFGLWNAAAVGAQIGVTQTVPSVSVSSGLFSAQIDFGSTAFDGSGRWLAIAVRCPQGTGGYTALDARQQLTAAPMAIYSTSAGNATSFSGTLSGDVTGTQSGTSVGALQGRPITTTAPSAGQVLAWNGSQWGPETAVVNYQNVVIVAKSGGNFTSIQAALDSITTASVSNRFLVMVMPGAYSERVTMKPYVDIEGSGELTTKITMPGDTGGTAATVVGADNAELRFITVESTGVGTMYTNGINNNGTSPRLMHVTAIAMGGANNFAIKNLSGATPTMIDVTASATSGGNCTGMYFDGYTTPTLFNLTSTASGCSGVNTGIKTYNTSPAFTNVIATGKGGTTARGMDLEFGNPNLTNVTATGSNASGDDYGIFAYSSAPTIQNSVVIGSGGLRSYGLYTNSYLSVTLKITNSRISGATNTITNTTALNTVFVGGSQLDGGPAGSVAGSTITCVYVFSASFTPFACP